MGHLSVSALHYRDNKAASTIRGGLGGHVRQSNTSAARHVVASMKIDGKPVRYCTHFAPSPVMFRPTVPLADNNVQLRTHNNTHPRVRYRRLSQKSVIKLVDARKGLALRRSHQPPSDDGPFDHVFISMIEALYMPSLRLRLLPHVYKSIFYYPSRWR